MLVGRATTITRKVTAAQARVVTSAGVFASSLYLAAPLPLIIKSLKDRTPVITLSLLHPIQSVPVQSWPFENESLIRIGRSTDNEVILYSAVVSRHHVELRRNGSDWEIVSLGANGTYIDGRRITHMSVVDGMIIRLASSGPKIQIHIDSGNSQSKVKAGLEKPSLPSTGVDHSKDTFINAKTTHSEADG